MAIIFDRPAFGGGQMKIRYKDGATTRTKILKPGDMGKPMSLESTAAEADVKKVYPNFFLNDMAAYTAKKTARKADKDNNRKRKF